MDGSVQAMETKLGTIKKARLERCLALKNFLHDWDKQSLV